MAIAYSIPDVTSIGARMMSIDFLTLDNSYPNPGGGNGGYTINPAFLGLISIQALTAVANDEGIIFQYNTVTGKLQAFIAPGGGGGNTKLTSVTNSPSAVTMDPYTPAGSVSTSSITEAVAIAGDTGTLAFVPVNVTAIYVTAGGATGPYDIIPSGAGAPAAGQVSVNFGTGALIFNAADAVTACSVVYQNSGGNFAGTPASLTGSAAAQANSPHQHTIGAGAAGALTEVANGVDLSGITALQIVAIGQ